MHYTLTITSHNSAMTDDEYGGTGNAVADLLEQAARDAREGVTRGFLRDVNGHQVGSWRLTR